ncbi:MAG: response regulator [Desulfobacteraceae bacterium]|nr:response regulator [Desulfobacteraceae bacterium]
METKDSILIVDDDPKLRKTLSDILKAKGYTPVTVATGKEALDRVKGEIPALALIDLKLEDMSGLEVLRGIKECSPGTECIVITGYASKESAIEAVNLGAYGYVQKPYDMEQLLLTIRRAIEKRQVEDNLRESEAKLSKAQQMAHIGNWNWNVVKNRISWSDELYRIVGLSPQQFDANYEAYLQCIHPDDLEFFKNMTRKALRDKKSYTAEYRIVRPNDDVRTVQELGEVTVDANGDPINLFGTVQDLTERKHEEEQYRTIIQTAIDGFWIVDTKGLLLDVNNAACMMLGYQREELLKMHISDIEAMRTPDEIADHIQRIIEQGYDSFETQHRGKDGTIIDVQTSIQYSNLRGGIFIAFMRDISEQKRGERTLRESEKRFRTVADFTYAWESWIGPDGKYIYVSPSCERTTGYSVEEFFENPGLFLEIVHPDDRENVSVHVRGHLEGTGDNHIDFRITTREDDLRWISHYCLPVYDEDGNWLGMRASNRDITDRMKLSEQLAQSQKMEGIGRLAGGVAHDFNNLLTTIIGYTEILLTQADKDSPLRTGMEEIKLASDRAANLTRQLLAFSRKQMIQPVVFNLNYPLTEMDKMLRRLIGENIDLATVLEPELWKVKFDPGQMDQVVMNLAVNARDAMPEGGKLTIETANVFLDEAYARQHGVELEPGPFVMVAVSDTGMGIDEEIQSHIFEPFFTTKEKGKGTGLGLSTVYGIVKQSGGFIWVYSEPGQGTTFKIYLPKAEEEEEFAEEEQMKPQNLEGSETILLAEDDDSARKLIRSILQEYGYSILEAQDGKEALRLSEQHEGPIHLLLTDVVMPGMNGRELAERLQPLQPRMKVLYMSGYTDNAIVHNGVLESGMPFIQKPFAPKVLASKCRKVLDT